ncbi:DUF1829 domain-containing protein [Sporosarcina sp. Marseille-Q4943]|uniref:DUF1829 domain-containing protein n=1 Tax=Sporosarcina sp. Marseille-Q4943 TaxID=2942204 RepID=UPI00208DAA6B|nr:DUF1829 domain-containing protein [Sporosarcina sp. Marseille-Q4943]
MIDQLKKAYEDWNKSHLNFSQIEDFVEITTPFVDINHDFIQVFLEKKPTGTYRLTDDGNTLNELEMRGVFIKGSKNRTTYFDSTLCIFGVSHDKDTGELFLTVPTIEALPQKQNNLLQCILRIFDMLLTSRNMVTNIFFEEVENYFIEKDVIFTPNLGFTGRSGNQQNFDFVIPHWKGIKEKLIYIVNSPKSDNYKPALFPFIDVRETRPNADFFVLANDTETAISPKFIEPIRNYNIEILEWSHREDWIKQLKVI